MKTLDFKPEDRNNYPNMVTLADVIEVLEQHRPVKRLDKFAIVNVGKQYEVQCRKCDEDNWKIWVDGKDEIEIACYYWKHIRPRILKQFGLKEENGVYKLESE